MLKDIDFKKVIDTAMAVVPEQEEGEQIWNAYLINRGEETLKNILVNSKGYGKIDGKEVKTSQLRQFIEELAPQSFVKVEIIKEDLLQLTNEFWISFSKDEYLFDKKYVFVLESLRKDNLTQIPILEQNGVLIK